MNKKSKNIHPLRIIGIIKNLNRDELARIFSVSSSQIGRIENDNNSMNFQTLKVGLQLMGISVEQYMVINRLSKLLSKMSIDNKTKIMCMIYVSSNILIDPVLKYYVDFVTTDVSKFNKFESIQQFSDSIIHPFKIIRIVKNLNCDELAKYFFTSSSRISRIENNKCIIDFQTLKSGLQAMDISVDDYLTIVNLGVLLSKIPIDYEKKLQCMIYKTSNIIMDEKLKNVIELFLPNEKGARKIKI